MSHDRGHAEQTTLAGARTAGCSLRALTASATAHVSHVASSALLAHVSGLCRTPSRILEAHDVLRTLRGDTNSGKLPSSVKHCSSDRYRPAISDGVRVRGVVTPGVVFDV